MRTIKMWTNENKFLNVFEILDIDRRYTLYDDDLFASLYVLCVHTVCMDTVLQIRSRRFEISVCNVLCRNPFSRL